MAPACQSNSTCLYCNGKPNSFLHFDKLNKGEPREHSDSDMTAGDQPSTSSAASNQQPQVHSCIAAKSINTHIFLSTAVVLVTDSSGYTHNCRVDLDSGTMVNFISKSFLNTLRLIASKTELPVRGIEASQVQFVAIVEIQIKSKIKKYDLTLPCYILPSVVSELPLCTTPIGGWNISFEIREQLADPNFNKAGSVDLLIRARIFYELLEANRVPLGVGNLNLQCIKFGWTVTGELVATCLLSLNSMGESIEYKWKSILVDKDAYGQESKANQKFIEEGETLQHFKNTFQRDKDGQFVLRLPIKPEIINLGSSLWHSIMATSRFINIERRLQHDDHLRKKYTNFMNDYLEMGYMQEVNTESGVQQYACFLPHHPIIKILSLTTKTRVVFDASEHRQASHSMMC